MALTGMLVNKETMAGFTTIIAGLAACRSAQGPCIPVTTCANSMNFVVGVIYRYTAGSAVGADMAG